MPKIAPSNQSEENITQPLKRPSLKENYKQYLLLMEIDLLLNQLKTKWALVLIQLSFTMTPIRKIYTLNHFHSHSVMIIEKEKI